MDFLKKWRLTIGQVFTFFLFLPLGVLGFDHSHRSWNETLASYQDQNGMIRYAKLKNDSVKPNNFTFYIDSLQKVTHQQYQSWNANQKKAFLINAYNALTFKLIIDHYPVKSIKKIGGLFTKPWSVKFFKLLDGKIQSIDPIEHDWLRPNFKDYRIHAAVNCASISCPPLRHEAFVAEKLDQQLDEQMRLWLSDTSRNKMVGKKYQLSKIFDWYQKDFDSWGGGILSVVNKYRAGEKVPDAKISYLDYNWDLNEAK